MNEQAQNLIERLALQPHPEGGHYAEVFRSPTTISTARGDRSALTSIYFLLNAGEHSAWHVVDSDEIWNYYEGAGIDLLTYNPVSQVVEVIAMGPLSNAGNVSQYVVPAGIWQAARPKGDYALCGCAVGPGFDFADFMFVRDVESYANLVQLLGAHVSLL